jgi:hypothetical protein
MAITRTLHASAILWPKDFWFSIFMWPDLLVYLYHLFSADPSCLDFVCSHYLWPRDFWFTTFPHLSSLASCYSWFSTYEPLSLPAGVFVTFHLIYTDSMRQFIL